MRPVPSASLHTARAAPRSNAAVVPDRSGSSASLALGGPLSRRGTGRARHRRSVVAAQDGVDQAATAFGRTQNTFRDMVRRDSPGRRCGLTKCSRGSRRSVGQLPIRGRALTGRHRPRFTRHRPAHNELALLYRQVGDTAIVREHLAKASSRLHTRLATGGIAFRPLALEHRARAAPVAMPKRWRACEPRNDAASVNAGRWSRRSLARQAAVLTFETPLRPGAHSGRTQRRAARGARLGTGWLSPREHGTDLCAAGDLVVPNRCCIEHSASGNDFGFQRNRRRPLGRWRRFTRFRALRSLARVSGTSARLVWCLRTPDQRGTTGRCGCQFARLALLRARGALTDAVALADGPFRQAPRRSTHWRSRSSPAKRWPPPDVSTKPKSLAKAAESSSIREARRPWPSSSRLRGLAPRATRQCRPRRNTTTRRKLRRCSICWANVTLAALSHQVDLVARSRRPAHAGWPKNISMRLPPSSSSCQATRRHRRHAMRLRRPAHQRVGSGEDIITAA